jgi:hypothetical protein
MVAARRHTVFTAQACACDRRGSAPCRLSFQSEVIVLWGVSARAERRAELRRNEHARGMSDLARGDLLGLSVLFVDGLAAGDRESRQCHEALVEEFYRHSGAGDAVAELSASEFFTSMKEAAPTPIAEPELPKRKLVYYCTKMRCGKLPPSLLGTARAACRGLGLPRPPSLRHPRNSKC